MNKPLPLSNPGAPPYQPHLWNKFNPYVKATHNCYTYMLNDLLKKPRKNGKPQPGYFFNHLSKMKRNMTMNATERISCNEVREGVRKDNPNIQVLSLVSGRKRKCPTNCYKGFLMVARGGDYHFAREDNRLIPVYRKMHSHKLYEKLKPLKAEDIARVFIAYIFRYAPAVAKAASTAYPTKMNSSNSLTQVRAMIRCSRLWSHKPGGSDAVDTDANNQLIINPELASWNYSHMNYDRSCCYFIIPNNKFKPTFSSGIPSNLTNISKNDTRNLMKGLSTKESVDSKYEKLIRSACRV